jgi:hypothetical protein
MFTAYRVIPGLLLIAFAGAVALLLPQAAHSLGGWLVGFGALLIRL